MKIVLSWPDKRLSPNARVHWGAKATAKKKAREDAALATYAAMPHGAREIRQAYAGAHTIPVRITFYPPDNRRRDDDNMVGSFKSLRDGIADALAVDDRRFKAHYFFEDSEAPGRIEVIL